MSTTTPQYFLEFTFTASAQNPLNELVTGTVNAVAQATKRVKNGRVLFLFKVLAEAKLIAVIQASDVAELESALAVPCASQLVQVRCTPLRPYVAFAREVLGVETTVQQNVEWASSPGQFYWVTVEVEYKGLTQEELFKIWKEEAIAGLAVMEQGGAKLWKVVSERKIQVLLKMPTPDLVDDTFTVGLPLFKQHGNQVHTTCKAVVPYM